VRTLKTSEAAALLSVSPNTLREWERRFGYPKPLRSPGKHRHYTEAEITELREALSRGLSISSAVSVAREALKADSQTLLSALTSFAAEDADRAMEGSLALRSMERTYLGALELFCVRAGAAVFSLSVEAQSSIRDAVNALRPDAGGLAGDHIGDEATSRWAYTTRTATGAVPFTLYCRTVANHGAGRSPALPTSPSKAKDALFAAIDQAGKPNGNGRRFSRLGENRAARIAGSTEHREPPDR
jgi:DNA-binding transcriptional MerR regulator